MHQQISCVANRLPNSRVNVLEWKNRLSGQLSGGNYLKLDEKLGEQRNVRQQ